MSTNSLKELVDAIKAQGKTLANASGASAATSRDLVYLSTAVERLFGADALMEMIDTATKPAEVISVGLATAAAITITDEQAAKSVLKLTNSDGSNAQSGFVVTAPTKGVAFVLDNALPIPVTVKTLGQTANIPSIPANTTGWVYCDGTNYSHVIDTAAIASAVTTPMTTAGDMTYKEGAPATLSVNYSVHVRNYGAESYYYIRPLQYDDGGFHTHYDITPTLSMFPSRTYVFDVSDASNSGHIFSFSTTSDGTHNSGAALVSWAASGTHVTRSGTEGTAGATVTVTMPATPNVSTVYYYSQGTDSATFDTVGLGGQINIITGAAVTRLPVGDYGDTLAIDRYTGKPIWQNWGSNENRKVASLSRDTTGLWSGGRYRLSNYITDSTGSPGDATYNYAANVGTWDMTPNGWGTYEHSSAIVYNRGKLEGANWGYQSEGSNGKYYNGDSMWEINGYAKNGVGQGGFRKDDDGTEFSDVIQVVNLYSISMHLLANGDVYITGHGDEGQQADGANTDRQYFHKVTFPSNAGRVRKIVSDNCSGSGVSISCMVLMEDGDLYSWGYGVNGQLGLGNVTNYNTVQKVTAFDKNVKSISVGSGDYGHCMAITNDNKLYSWGYNGYGQCGRGNTTTIHSTPVEISVSGQIPVKVQCCSQGSYGTSTVLMRSGRVYQCGYNAQGQLGNGNTTNQTTLTQVGGGLGVDTNKHVIDIFPRSGYGHNVWFLLEDGSLYACGDNSLGVHGRGSVTTSISTPSAVSADLTWVSEIIAPHGDSPSYYQTMFIVHKNKEDRIARRNGWIYMTGYAALSIGFYDFQSPISSPMCPALPNGVNGTIVMGSCSGVTGFSSSHTPAWQVLDKYGDMYNWGYDSSQQLGGEGNRYIPVKRTQ
jgi:alpha-tubulin suppressor-like RCC1 family protein